MDPHETKIFHAVILASGVIGIIVIYFIISIVRNQRRHLKMQHKNLFVEITTLENERRRIVSDLHDELGPLLSVVKLQVSSIEARNHEDVELLDKAGHNLDIILERIRGICNHLMPQVLDRKGLIAAINGYVCELHSRRDVKISFNHDYVNIPVNQQVHIYRMIQESVNNAVKHSHARHIYIHLHSENGKIILEVRDDGCGFETEKVMRESKGLGLKNILSRADVLKGDMYLVSSPGNGTALTVEIPNT